MFTHSFVVFVMSGGINCPKVFGLWLDICVDRAAECLGKQKPRPVVLLMKSTVVNLPAGACRLIHVDALDRLVVDVSAIQLLLLSK